MIGRTGFVGDLLYSLPVSGFIYPIMGHWAWGPDGFLATMGSAGNFLPGIGTSFHDFAGSTVRFHDLRHTFASWYMMNGGDLYELAKILGHSNIASASKFH